MGPVIAVMVLMALLTVIMRILGKGPDWLPVLFLVIIELIRQAPYIVR